MREILFKAKRLDNGEWVEGYICKHPSAVQAGDCSPWYIHVPPIDPDDNGGVYNIDPSTVCQYTGKTDKNGVKVFECDRVKVRWTESSELCEGITDVKWCAEDCCFEPFGWAYSCGECGSYSEVEEVEVIGNIRDKEEPECSV